MATTKVSALVETTSPQANDELLINQSGVSKKLKVSNFVNAAITANNAKVTNATHTGDVTGATALTIGTGKVITAMILDDNVTADKLANSINAEIAANTAKVTNATHTGDVTGATALTIAAGAVDLAMLSATGTPGSGNFLRGDNAWEAVDGLPSQTGNAGKYLTTDAANASWATLDTDANTTTKGLYEMANVIATSYSITSGNNALSAGPITINTGIAVTVPSGSTWVIA